MCMQANPNVIKIHISIFKNFLTRGERESIYWLAGWPVQVCYICKIESINNTGITTRSSRQSPMKLPAYSLEKHFFRVLLILRVNSSKKERKGWGKNPQGETCPRILQDFLSRKKTYLCAGETLLPRTVYFCNSPHQHGCYFSFFIFYFFLLFIFIEFICMFLLCPHFFHSFLFFFLMKSDICHMLTFGHKGVNVCLYVTTWAQ